MKPKELMKVLAEDGWQVVRIQGSHHIHKHPTNLAPYLSRSTTKIWLQEP